jgi:Arm DNA-binding domain
VKTALSDHKIKAAKPAKKSYDVLDTVVPGLALRVMPSGTKSLVLISRFPGAPNPTRRSLGLYGRITLRAARIKARKWFEQLQRGIDPAVAIKKQRTENEARATLERLGAGRSK